jgi:NAD(P)-dependent dehydrogenase (short-subunit alcohol dehydrogenase family)
MAELSGKVAIVTGASRGIGAARGRGVGSRGCGGDADGARW